MENEPLPPETAVEPEKPAESEMLSVDDLELEAPGSAEKAPRVKDLLSSLDTPSRFVTLLSVIFAMLAVICIASLAYIIVSNQRARARHAAEAEQPVAAVEPTIQESLGYYSVVLKAEPTQMHDFDLHVDISAECSTYEACDSLKEKKVETRDLIQPILSSITREEMLSQDGKNRIRRRIAEQLNGLTTNGKVIQIHFTNMTIETGR